MVVAHSRRRESSRAGGHTQERVFFAAVDVGCPFGRRRLRLQKLDVRGKYTNANSSEEAVSFVATWVAPFMGAEM